jgi:O-succinylbenzoic acid--CoA ligase
VIADEPARIAELGVKDAATAPSPTVWGSETVDERMDRAGVVAGGASPDGALSFDAERPAAIIWTSGSSGTPRAVLLTAANLDANAEATLDRLGLNPDDRWALTLSPAHVGGLALIWRARWMGSEVVADGHFDLDRFVGRVQAGEVTHASLVPIMLRRLLDHPGMADESPSPPAHRLRAVLIGGAYAAPELLLEALARGIPVAPTYGMTETTSQVATAHPDAVSGAPGSVGRPLAGVELRIRAREILVRGPIVARSAAVGGGEDTPLVDPEGWFATGDLGHLGPDGSLTVTGRIGDRIISGGTTVSPGEVEQALLALPEVTDAAVVGLSDDEWGQCVAALLVGDSSLDVGAVRTALRGVLSTAKLPRTIAWTTAVPRNANGKVDRTAVRTILAEVSR